MAYNDPKPRSSTWYAIAAIAVGLTTMLWFPLLRFAPVDFNVYKWDRVMTTAAVMSIILAFAAYREGGSGGALKHWALAVGLLAFVAHVLIFPS